MSRCSRAILLLAYLCACRAPRKEDPRPVPADASLGRTTQPDAVRAPDALPDDAEVEQQIDDLGMDSAEVHRWLVEHEDRSRPYLVVLLQKPIDQDTRRSMGAMYVLAEWGHAEDVPLIAGRLQGDDPHITFMVAGALRRHPASEAADALSTAAASSSEAVAWAAVHNLGTRHDERGRTALEHALEDPRAKIRLVAVKALMRLGPLGSKDAIERRMKVESDKEIKSRLAKAHRGETLPDPERPDDEE